MHEPCTHEQHCCWTWQCAAARHDHSKAGKDMHLYQCPKNGPGGNWRTMAKGRDPLPIALLTEELLPVPALR